MTSRFPSDKRIAQRVSASTDISWLVPRKKMLRTATTEAPCRVLNVSVTGVGLVAEPEPMVGMGTVVTLLCGGFECRGRVRQITQKTDGAKCYFGLEFVEPTREFTESLLAGSELESRGEYEQSWLRDY